MRKGGSGFMLKNKIKWSAERLLQLGVGLALLILAGVGLLAYRSTESLIDNSHLVAHTQEVLAELKTTLSRVAAGESSQRGYLLTGDASYLGPYHLAVQEVGNHLNSLRTLTADNPRQQARVVGLDAALKTRMDLLERCIKQYEIGGIPAAQHFLLTSGGKQAMENVTQQVGAMEAEERNLLAIRTRDAESSAHSTVAVYLTLLALGFLLLLALYTGTRRHIAQRTQAEATVRALNNSLEQRVAERTAQLQVANKELEAFSYSVSHDLRAPLRAVSGFSSAVLEDYGDKLDAEGRRYLDLIGKGAQDMGRLIDDLLSFSRMNRLQMEHSTVDMTALTRGVVAELSRANEKRHIEFDLSDLPPATGDSAMLRQVFVNLLSNAVKFTATREAACIKIGSRAEAGENVYLVADNGAGFDMRHANKLFGVFQRLHSASEFDGTGVGLAIVQRIVHRHGGRVWAEGQVDHGATFYFSLPTGGASTKMVEGAIQ